MAGKREETRERNTTRILEVARREIARHGGGGLSMRAVAREVGMVSSAVYRYFPTREALLTAMIVESYGSLDAALAAVPHHADPARRWRALSRAFRDWGLAAPHEFQLIYGTPIPGYVAPPETVPAAAAVAGHFLDVGARRAVPAYASPRLRSQLATVVAGSDLDPSGAAGVIAELAALVGVVLLELGGHLVGTADPADQLYAALLDRQVATLLPG